MSKWAPLDPYALFEALERHRVGYVVIGGFARVVHGSGELPGRLTIVPRPWGTRGYDDFRIRANRENLGRGLRSGSPRPGRTGPAP